MTTRRSRAADPMPEVVITVLGQPQAQGSKTRTRYGMREANTELRPWRNTVTYTAIDQVTGVSGYAKLRGPLQLAAAFSFRRPKSHYRTGRNAHLLRDSAPLFPTGKPDLSKLVRAVEDGLTDAGVWADDAQVVDYCGTRKVWCSEHPFALAQPGVLIYVTAVTW